MRNGHRKRWEMWWSNWESCWKKRKNMERKRVAEGSNEKNVNQEKIHLKKNEDTCIVKKKGMMSEEKKKWKKKNHWGKQWGTWERKKLVKNKWEQWDKHIVKKRLFHNFVPIFMSSNVREFFWVVLHFCFINSHVKHCFVEKSDAMVRKLVLWRCFGTLVLLKSESCQMKHIKKNITTTIIISIWMMLFCY